MKKWWKSKMLWLNGLTALAAALEATTGMLKPYIGEGGYVLLLILLPVANAMLRVVSTTKLTK